MSSTVGANNMGKRMLKQLQSVLDLDNDYINNIKVTFHDTLTKYCTLGSETSACAVTEI
jgi:hypothetical protein